MSSKAKTIIGILLLVIIVAGAYYSYNALSSMNQPEIIVPERNNTDEANNSDIASTDNNMGDTDVSDSNDSDQNSNVPEENKSEENSEDAEQSETQQLKAFDFTVYNQEGEQVNLSDFFGKPIILNFWATWCPYCVQEMPVFEEYFNKYKDDIHFLMVDSVDGQRETKEKGEKFIKDNEYTFPVYFDLDYDATITYQAYSLPTTILLIRMAI